MQVAESTTPTPYDLDNLGCTVGLQKDPVLKLRIVSEILHNLLA